MAVGWAGCPCAELESGGGGLREGKGGGGLRRVRGGGGRLRALRRDDGKACGVLGWGGVGRAVAWSVD